MGLYRPCCPFYSFIATKAVDVDTAVSAVNPIYNEGEDLEANKPRD
jgi:hypothetical protein